MKKRILLIEDSLAWIKLIKLHFEGDYAITCVKNGLDAIEVLFDDSIDLIILDTLLPAVSGFGIINEIKSHIETMNIPIVIVSDIKIDDFNERYLKAYGIKLLYSKDDVDLSEMKIRIKKILK